MLHEQQHDYYYYSSDEEVTQPKKEKELKMSVNLKKREKGRMKKVQSLISLNIKTKIQKRITVK